MTVDNLILAALVSEFTATATAYIKKFDNLGRDHSGAPQRNVVSHVAFVSRSLRVLRQEQACLVCFRPELVSHVMLLAGSEAIIRL